MFGVGVDRTPPKCTVSQHDTSFRCADGIPGPSFQVTGAGKEAVRKSQELRRNRPEPSWKTCGTYRFSPILCRRIPAGQHWEKSTNFQQQTSDGTHRTLFVSDTRFLTKHPSQSQRRFRSFPIVGPPFIPPVFDDWKPKGKLPESSDVTPTLSTGNISKFLCIPTNSGYHIRQRNRSASHPFLFRPASNRNGRKHQKDLVWIRHESNYDAISDHLRSGAISEIMKTRTSFAIAKTNQYRPSFTTFSAFSFHRTTLNTFT